MKRARRPGALPAVLLLLGACADEGSGVERALAFLAHRQDSDGLWHSATYGLLARGESTTAALALALAQLAPAARRSAEPHLERALAALARRSAPSPAVPPEPIDYPCYTAAHRLHALSILQPDDFDGQRDELIAFLRRHQLAEAAGWPVDAPEYGGFGLGDRERAYPAGADLVGLSATTAVLEALAAARVPITDDLVVRARRFVERCQQFGDAGDDGGFCFAPTRDWRAMKAGSVADACGRDRARSYGTATADGIRALLASGHAPDSARVQAALAWLDQHADPCVPGLEHATDPTLEPSLRLYWLAALAAVARRVPAHPRSGSWRDLVRTELAARQAADGRFVGLGASMKEDDPLVATALALFAHGALDASDPAPPR